jgi:hypothetical protein
VIVGFILLAIIITTVIILLLVHIYSKKGTHTQFSCHYIKLLLKYLLLLHGAGMDSVNINTEAVYEDPDSFQQYTPREDQNIELKESPAYGSRQPDIDLKECPAYEKPPDIVLEECPAYVEKKKDVSNNIELEECPAYGHMHNIIPS